MHNTYCLPTHRVKPKRQAWDVQEVTRPSADIHIKSWRDQFAVHFGVARKFVVRPVVVEIVLCLCVYTDVGWRMCVCDAAWEHVGRGKCFRRTAANSGERRKKTWTADRAHCEEARYVHEDVIPHARLESGAVHSLVQGHEVEWHDEGHANHWQHGKRHEGHGLAYTKQSSTSCVARHMG